MHVKLVDIGRVAAYLVAVAAILGTPTFAQNEGAEVPTSFPLGEEIYQRDCSTCHQADGAGLPGAFPPLNGHAPTLFRADGGRSYLAKVVLHGLQGQISAAGARYNGSMPAWGAQLSDEQVAAVLNHVLTNWDNAAELSNGFEPYVATDVAEARDANLTPQDVHGLRQQLALGDGAQGSSQGASGSVWDGVYTEEQAARGRDVFDEHCASCHGRELGGGENAPSLTGGLFMLHWADSSVASLFEYVRSEMPLGRPGTLSDQQYINAIAVIMQGNDFPAGDSELPPDPDVLQGITIERSQ